MARARKGSAIKNKINLLLYGAPFSGKSTLAMQAALLKDENGDNYRVFAIDCESGGLDEAVDSVVSQGANADDIYVLYTQSLTEIKEYINKIANNEDLIMLDEDGEETDEVVLDSHGKPFRPNCVIVDGTSVLKMTTQSSLISLSQKRNKIKAEKAGATSEEKYVQVMTAGMELKDWNKMGTIAQDFVLSLMSLPCSVILTSREKDETVSQKDSEGHIASIATGKKVPDSLKGIEYNSKQIFRMYKDDETGDICAYVEKDRTRVHNFGEVLVDPTLLDYQEMLDKSIGKEAFNVKNDFDKAVETDQKIFEKEILGKDYSEEKKDNTAEECKHVIEEIKGILNKLPVADKKVKRDALKAAGLPDQYTKVTDISVLNQILEVVSK
jgi:hypothetical protein